jgi:hypothetical protein
VKLDTVNAEANILRRQLQALAAPHISQQQQPLTIPDDASSNAEREAERFDVVSEISRGISTYVTVSFSMSRQCQLM